MKHLNPLIQVSILMFFGCNLFAGNSIFSYEREKLLTDFSGLIILEEALTSSNMTIAEIQNSGLMSVSMDSSLQDEGKCVKARSDAALMYKPTGPAWGSFCCTAGTNPLFGLILALVMNKETPKDGNLGLTDYNLLSDADYINCYRAAALEKKKKAVWTSFGIGTVVYLVVEIYYFAVVYPTL